MEIISREFSVEPGTQVDLKKWPTVSGPYFKSKQNHKKLLKDNVAKLSNLQRLHFAARQYSLLLIFHDNYRSTHMQIIDIMSPSNEAVVSDVG